MLNKETFLPPNDPVEYLVITPDSVKDTFNILANWKMKKGWYSEVKSVEDIYASYPGNDKAAKIRNCIKDYYTNKGTIWVLLGGGSECLWGWWTGNGDTGIYADSLIKVPVRFAFAMAQNRNDYPPYDDSITCELYFSDLDGTWDANNNGVYGELADNIDLYPDVFVGRLPANTNWQSHVMVRKVMAYEKSPPLSGYVKRAAFFGYELYPYGLQLKELKKQIKNNYLPADWQLTEGYSSNGGYGRQFALQVLNTGPHLANHADHANNTGLFFGVGDAGASGAYVGRIQFYDSIWTYDSLIIMYSIGCWANAFHCRQPLTKFMLLDTLGGVVAFIGNTNYGYPSTVEQYLSTTLEGAVGANFYKAILQQNIYHLGNAVAQAKAWRAYAANAENKERCIQYHVILAGDPEMPVWTNNPSSFTVTYPESIGTVPLYFTVRVTSSGAPVESAYVCLMQLPAVYDRGWTNSSGEVTFHIDADTGAMFVTVTKHNYIPFEGEVFCSGHGVEEPVYTKIIKFDVYPNPALGIAKINYEVMATKELAIKIYDISGRVIASFNNLGLSGEIKWQTKISGIYFAELIAGKTKLKKKLVVLSK